MTTIYNVDSEQELQEVYNDLENNPDFELLGYYEMIQDIYEELNYQGFNDEQIEQFTKNQYGTCLEIIYYPPHDEYIAFLGTR